MKKLVIFGVVALGALTMACGGGPDLPTIDPPAPPVPVNPSDSTNTEPEVE